MRCWRLGASGLVLSKRKCQQPTSAMRNAGMFESKLFSTPSLKHPRREFEGIGVKLALANFLDGFDDGGESAVSAYLDTVRMLDRDFLAEAEAVVERSKESGSRVFARGCPAERSRQAERSS